jgi:hypothetical protein
MRSDDRDFVDDMLDDVTGGAVQVSAPPAGYVRPPTPTGAGNQVLSVGATPASGTYKTVAPAGGGGMDIGKLAAGFFGGPLGLAAAMGAGGSSGSRQTTTTVQPVALTTPGSAPHLETPSVAMASRAPLAVTAIPGEEGQTLGQSASQLAQAVSSITDPRLRSILGSIRAMRVQSQATSEHAALTAQQNFRKDITARLARIESRLPTISSLRQQLSTLRTRIVPVMLG